MTLTTGSAAPAFTLPSAPGQPEDVGAMFGTRKIVLLFIPLAFSPVCTDEFCAFRDDWQAWDSLGASVFGISVDSPFVTDKFRKELDVPFPVLSDFNKEVSAMYGAIHEDLMGLKGVAKRSAFVIDSNGMVAFEWISDDPGTQVPFDQVKAAVEAAD
ncbi:MAG: peroxiredoxin [Phycisphaerae bacterium]|nr:peroxiredoxin [Phycisphaerae bacterium]